MLFLAAAAATLERTTSRSQKQFATGATTTAFLRDFQAEFHHLLKVAVAQNAIVGLPDHDAEHEHDEQLHPSVGRWGIAPAIHATIKAFFSLHQEDASASSSMEQE